MHSLFQIKEDLVDGDDESSGSGFGGDDEDEQPSLRPKPHEPKIDREQRPKETNIHQSGDGHTDSEEDYYDETEPKKEFDSEKDKDSDFTFDTATTETSSTSTTSTTTKLLPTDDEDSQFHYFYLKLGFPLGFWSLNTKFLLIIIFLNSTTILNSNMLRTGAHRF